MRKVLLAFSLSLLVSFPLAASPHKVPHRPSPKGAPPIATILAQIRSFLRGSSPTNNEHQLPPPPSTVIAGS